MKKLQLSHWLFVGAMSALVFACQSNNSTPPKNVAPCKGADCPAPPQAPYQDKVPCREGECDEMEAGEEAGIHVIEITEPEEKSAAVEPNATGEKTNNVSLTEESTNSPEVKTEEPTTHIFDELPHVPVSENTVVITLKG